jgi:hypothetical protein
MTRGFAAAIFCAGILLLTNSFSLADPPQFPQNATFTTLITTPRAIEGLTGDGRGNLYTGGSGSAPCPVWKINYLRLPWYPLGSFLCH